MTSQHADTSAPRTKRAGLIEKVIDRLRAEVSAGRWPVGTRIPTEPELAELTGTGRNTVREAVEASLRRLNTDVIDLYQVHWPVAGADPADTIGALVDLRDQGKIRAIGVSNYAVADL